jgi:3-oxoacyl-[acyl-carrier-protein] synthase-1
LLEALSTKSINVSDKVFITGIGIISSIGFNYDEVAFALKSTRSGIGNITLLDTIYKDEILAAEVKATDKELKEISKVNSNISYSRTALLGIIAAKQAMISAGISDNKGFRTGLVSATTVGGMDRSEKFYKEYLKNKSRGRLSDIITHDCASSTEIIADELSIHDYVSTISTACSSSANAIMLGSRLIENGILDSVLVGGVDALTIFTLNGFNSLMILDRTGCKPFDEERNGLTLGEGAGFLMIESEQSVRQKGTSPLCEIKGYGNACDAFHQTALSPEGEGAFLSMQKAVNKAGIKPEMIDYINAHGTGTKNNDLSEGTAIQRLFKGQIPPFSSTKSYTGHTLGAAGAIEAIFCVLALKNKWIYPNLNFKQPMTGLGFSPVTSFGLNINLQNVMSNSFGFGGNNTSLIFSQP